MFPPPDSTDHPGCTPRRDVEGSALDQRRPSGPPHQTLGRSTAGVFCEDPEGPVQFHEATHLTASDWDQLRQTVRHRMLRYFHRHGLLERHVTDDMLTWQASGGFSTVRLGRAQRLSAPLQKEEPPPDR